MHKFDIIIENGFTQEADAEMQRLAAEELDEDQKKAVAEEVFNAHVRVLEHAEPLVKNNFFEYYMDDGTERQQFLVYEYFRFFNKQKTVDDKLKAVAAFRRMFYPLIKKSQNQTILRILTISCLLFLLTM